MSLTLSHQQCELYLRNLLDKFADPRIQTQAFSERTKSGFIFHAGFRWHFAAIDDVPVHLISVWHVGSYAYTNLTEIPCPVIESLDDQYSELLRKFANYKEEGSRLVAKKKVGKAAEKAAIAQGFVDQARAGETTSKFANKPVKPNKTAPRRKRKK